MSQASRTVFLKWSKIVSIASVVKNYQKNAKIVQNCQKLSLKSVIRNCHQKLPAKIAIKNCHQNCHHSDQMSQSSQVSRIALSICSRNIFVFVIVIVFVLVFVFVFFMVRSCLLITQMSQMS